MPAAIVARSETAFTIQVEIPYGSSMLDAEEAIQQRLNEAGHPGHRRGPPAVRRRRLADPGRRHQADQQGQAPEGVPDPLRRRPRRAARLPEQPGRQDLLPARPQRPDRRQFHPQVRQDGLAQVRRVRLGPGDQGPGREPRPAGRPLLRPGRRRCGGRRGAGQGGGLGVRPARVGGADRDDHHRDGRDLPADVRGRLAGDDGRHHRLLRRRRASGSTRSTWRRRRSTARRRSWTGWSGRSTGSRRPTRRPATSGWPTGRRGTGSSWAGTPRSR